MLTKTLPIFLILSLALISSLSQGDDHAASLESVLKQVTLADFENLGEDALKQDWRAAPEDKPDAGFRFSLENVEREGKPTRDLHLSYIMPGVSANNETAGQVQEIDLVLQLRGLDASDYDHLAFWIKGDSAEDFNKQIEVEFRRPHPTVAGLREEGGSVVGGIDGEWRRVMVPLKEMIGIRDWTNLSELVFALHARDTRIPQGGYFIDDIALIKTGHPGPGADDLVVAWKKKAWEEAFGGETAARPHLKDRLAGWPQQLLIDPNTLPTDEREFLSRLALDTWRGIDALTDKAHGLPLDRIHFGNGSVELADARIGDYTGVTNIGFHLLAIVAAHELKLIEREQALERLRLTLAALEQMETYQGFYYNYYNTTTLERTSNFISFVDSSWLTAGLMAARMAFPEIHERCTRLIEQGDYRFFYDDQWKLMSHGYYVNLGLRNNMHYGALYAESRIGSLIAIGKGEAPEEHWFAMARTFPNEFTWQSNQPLNRREKTERGFHWIGGYYQWRDYRYVPSWGGSLFEALMPALVLDEKRYAPANLGRNGEIHTEIQRRYALEELGYPVWGMSPSSMPGSERYTEYGVHILGSLGYPEGAVTPHAAALALLTEPEAASANLRQLAQRYPIYGDFGFYDAVDPKSGVVAYQYLCLNQAMILIALANHLGDHAVQKHFAADPIMQRALPLIGFENFFD